MSKAIDFLHSRKFFFSYFMHNKPFMVLSHISLVMRASDEARKKTKMKKFIFEEIIILDLTELMK